MQTDPERFASELIYNSPDDVDIFTLYNKIFGERIKWDRSTYNSLYRCYLVEDKSRFSSIVNSKGLLAVGADIISQVFSVWYSARICKDKEFSSWIEATHPNIEIEKILSGPYGRKLTETGKMRRIA